MISKNAPPVSLSGLVTEYSEAFYNRQRKQKRLCWLSPAAYEQWSYRNQLAA